MYTFLLILHFIGLAMGVGTSIAMFTLGISTRNLSPAEKGPFFAKASVLSKNGSYGLLLLILSGVGMVCLNPGLLSVGWAFDAKLACVVLISILSGVMQVCTRKAKRDPGGPASRMLPKLGRVGLILSLTIIVFAVLAFH